MGAAARDATPEDAAVIAALSAVLSGVLSLRLGESAIYPAGRPALDPNAPGSG
jgi:hypothetical protein